MVMVRIRLERFLGGTHKKLHSRSAVSFKIVKKISSNVYAIELLDHMGITSTLKWRISPFLMVIMP